MKKQQPHLTRHGLLVYHGGCCGINSVLIETYYKAGRYEDVILLADVTLEDRPYFEESYYYKGLALAAMGDASRRSRKS